ncbi:hypothetical protein QBC43DRAFT_308035 [Cladorrhinum sp. PSN259]|nr:hypothetical protein QBC43DRAFT_308035 [Cladorrhinum sp. PSN259]
MVTTTRKPALGVLTIQSDPQYSGLRICAQECVDKANNNRDIEGILDCGDSRILDSCFCRTDLRSIATQHLSTCILTRCGYDGPDYTSAVKVYDDYCSYTAPRITAAPSTTTESPTNRTTSFISTDTGPKITEFKTSDNVTDGSETSIPRGSLISAGAIAGIVIGGIVTLIAGILMVMWIHARQRREKRGQGQAGDEQPGKHQDPTYLPAGAFELVTPTQGNKSMASPREGYFEVHGSALVEIDSERKPVELSAGEDREGSWGWNSVEAGEKCR